MLSISTLNVTFGAWLTISQVVLVSGQVNAPFQSIDTPVCIRDLCPKWTLETFSIRNLSPLDLVYRQVHLREIFSVGGV